MFPVILSSRQAPPISRLYSRVWILACKLQFSIANNCQVNVNFIVEHKKLDLRNYLGNSLSRSLRLSKPLGKMSFHQQNIFETKPSVLWDIHIVKDIKRENKKY